MRKSGYWKLAFSLYWVSIMGGVMSRYNTNLASEFHVLSNLYRLGLDASLTLGNKKGIDIIVTHESGKIITIDVKGVSKRYDWPADNIKEPRYEYHLIALVCYEGKIDDPTTNPNTWVLPYEKLNPFLKQYKNRTVVSRSLINSFAGKYLHAWHLISDL